MTPKQIAAIDRAVARQRALEEKERIKQEKERAWARANPEQALKNLKRRVADRRRKLLDPNYLDQRVFPTWLKGMSTEQYITIYQAANNDSCYPLKHPLEFVSP